MSFPPGIGTCLITGTYLDGQGNGVAGSIVFSYPAFELIDATDHVIVAASQVTVPLVNGSFSVSLPFTDNTAVQPSGWSYGVAEQLASGVGRSYFIQVPRSTGATVDISTLVPASGSSTPVWANAPFLQIAKNLQDLNNVATARANLGLGTAATENVNTLPGTIAPLGTQAAGTSGLVPDAAHVHPMPRLDQLVAPTNPVAMGSQKLTSLANGSAATDAAAFGQLPRVPTPAVNAMTLWNMDPVVAASNTQLTAGKLYVMAIQVLVAMTINNLIVYITNAATGGTSGQNFAALLDSGGNRVAVTADQTTAWGSVGTASMPLTAAYNAVAGTFYVALLANATTTMRIAAASPSGQVANAGILAAPWRFASGLSGLTSIPASVTLTSLSQEFPMLVGTS